METNWKQSIKQSVIFVVPNEWRQLLQLIEDCFKEIKEECFGVNFLCEWACELAQYLWDYEKNYIYTNKLKLKQDIWWIWNFVINCKPDGPEIKQRQSIHLETTLDKIADLLIQKAKEYITDEHLSKKFNKSVQYYSNEISNQLDDYTRRIPLNSVDHFLFLKLFYLQQGLQEIVTSSCYKTTE